MNYLVFSLLIFGMFLSVSSSPKGNFFQVISSHPHEVEELSQYTDTVYQKGRLWVVQLKQNAPKEIMDHLRPLRGGEKNYNVKAPVILGGGRSKGNPLKTLVMKVDKELIRKDVEALSAFESRYVGTPGNEEALKLVSERFKRLGYKVERICYLADACNLVAEKKGTLNPGNVIMVMGHIDSVGHDFAGADDNGSGVAVMLEMARLIKNEKTKKTIRFFISNGEEVGNLGARFYANKLEVENKLRSLALVINMDMVGYNENGIVELETDPEFESVAKWFATLVSQYTSLKSKISLGAWGSDHVSFLQKGVPSLLTIEDWDTKTPCYHESCDTPDTLNYDYAAEIAKLNIAAVLTNDKN